MRKAISFILSLVVFASTVSLPFTKINSYAVDIDKIKEAASDAGSATKDALNNAGNAAKEKANSAGKAAQDIAEKAEKATQEAVGNAGKVSKEAADKAKEKATETGGYISENASKAYNSASTAAQSAGNSIKEYVSNIDTTKFKSGWDYASKYTGVAIASLKGQNYVNTVQKTISEHSALMQKELNDKVISARTIQQDAGFAAEIWHTNTFNIEAALDGSEYKAVRPDSNAKASVDVQIQGKDYTQDYSSKYYKDASSSANAQAKTFIEDYHEYASHELRHGKEPMTESEYLAQYDKPLDSLYDSLYSGQNRLIPADQLDDAREYLTKRKAKMSTSESVERQKFSPELQETLDSLADRIEAPDGTQSKPLTEAEAKQLVELTREGDLDLADFGITPSQLITTKYILKQSLNAGLQSAAVSTAFAIGPDLYSIIISAAKEGKIDEKALKEVGIEGVLAGSEGFVEGSISSALVIAFQSGKFGAAYTNISPETIGTLTVLIIDATRFGYQLSQGQITEAEYADFMAQDIFIAIASQASGALLQALFPFIPFAYVAGSMAGAMVASVGYEVGKEVILEIRGENGFETIVPETISTGKSLAESAISKIKLQDKLSEFQGMAVSALGNGKIRIAGG
ncbi:hypothetical protein [Butyrivibrio sp. XPD2006]|uniref:hypothetical protein n=1 Tax=Butyrivibrio sp. XPD2006 TaxID=1280668 RepID=UPI0003B441B0|nr:hypothetical protein [Butyrivibrio sp. XPD2006]